MAFKDILLALTSYPDPTPQSATESAAAIAARLDAHLAALACEVHVEVPGRFLSGSMANIPGIIAGETEKSRDNCRDMLAAFEAAATKAGVRHETCIEHCPTFAVPDVLVEHARLRDLTIVPVPESSDQWYAETIILVRAALPSCSPKRRVHAHSNWGPLPSPGISVARRRAPSPMRFHCSNRPGKSGSSP